MQKLHELQKNAVTAEIKEKSAASNWTENAALLKITETASIAETWKSPWNCRNEKLAEN